VHDGKAGEAFPLTANPSPKDAAVAERGDEIPKETARAAAPSIWRDFFIEGNFLLRHGNLTKVSKFDYTDEFDIIFEVVSEN
jgi:hypothetical protein